MDSREPKISVILKIAQMSKSLTITIDSLRNQTVSRDIELVLLTTMTEVSALQHETGGDFYRIEIVMIDDQLHEGEYKVAGISRATAPLIMFMEDHSYADSRCLEQIIKIHERSACAAVGPQVLNANPGSAVGWGCYLVFYGQWGYPQPEGRNEHLPANQSCYKRTILEDNAEGLADKMKTESVFHWDLINRGHKLILSDSAQLYHMNTSRLQILLHEYYLNSMIFAVSRFPKKARLKRLLYIIGAPFIPVVRFVRVARMYRTVKIPALAILSSLPSLLLCLSAGALGEAVGYSVGDREATDRLNKLLGNPDKLIKSRDLEEASRIVRGDS